MYVCICYLLTLLLTSIQFFYFYFFLFSSPIKHTWLGGARLASRRDTLRRYVVTRQDYLEHGPNWVLKKFAAGPVEA